MSGYYNRNNRGITKKLGPVTAYADAVLAGYTGTREQWAQDMAKLGQNVTQVAQNTKLTTELAEQTRVNTEQVAKDTADVRRLAEETRDNAVQVASNTAESNRLAEETKQAAAQAKVDAEYAGAAADNFRVDTTLSEEGKAAEAKTTGEKFAQLSEEKASNLLLQAGKFNSGGYIAVGGTIAKLDTFKYSDEIDISVLAGQEVKIVCSFVQSAGFAFYDFGRVCVGGMDGTTIGKNATEYITTVPENAVYLRLSWFADSGITEESCGVYGINTAETLGKALVNAITETIELEKGNAIKGYFISRYEGHAVYNDQWTCSDFIDVSQYNGWELRVRCSIGQSAGIAFYNAKKEFVNAIASDAYLYDRVHTIVIPTDVAYVRYAVVTSYLPFEESEVAVRSDVKKLVKPLTINFDIGELINDYYISGSDGQARSHPDSGFQCTDYISIGECRDLSLDVTCSLIMAAGYAFYDYDKNYISGMDGTTAGVYDDSAQLTVVIPENACYIRMSSFEGAVPRAKCEIYRSAIVSSVLKHNLEIEETKTRLNKIESGDIVPYEYAASKILCIGDSLTSGAYYAQGWTGSSIQQNYPYYLGRILNCETTNAGRSGWSASDWYRDYINTHEFANYDTVIIWLGTNYGCLSMPTDTEIEAFVPDATAEPQNANQALYLIEIIKTIQEVNPDCFILICGVFASKSNANTNNAVVQQIAAKYGLHYVSTLELSVSAAPELHCGIDNPHFGKAGNIYIANKFANEIRNIISKNPLLAEFGVSNRTN